MKSLFKGMLSLLMLLSSQVFAEQYLSYPVAQAPECSQVYDNTPEPKTLSLLVSFMNQLCRQRGGERVTYRVHTSGNSSEPSDVIVSCIGENPVDHIMFHCTYGSIIPL